MSSKRRRDTAKSSFSVKEKSRINYGRGFEDEDVEGSSGSEDEYDGKESEEDEIVETTEQKRRRLAKAYLASVSADGMMSDSDDKESDDDENEEDNDEDAKKYDNGFSKHAAISEKLRIKRLEASGRHYRNLADALDQAEFDFEDASTFPRSTMNAHTLPVTGVAMSRDESAVFSVSKDNSLIKWDVESGYKQILAPKWSRETHPNQQCCEGELLTVTCSSDDRYVVTGGRDKTIRIYDARQSHAEIKSFTGHRNAVTSLAFRRNTYSLFSASLDGTLKSWDLNEMGYIETLFGHQDAANCLDCWTKERPISSSTDRTCRLWKIVDESHLVFRGHKASIDHVSLLSDDTFITGSQDGGISLWKETQKKPVASVIGAHGMVDAYNFNWITAVQAVKMSNLAATGSREGYVRLWHANAESKSLFEVAKIAVDGVVNSLCMSSRVIVAGVGREPKLGRWWSEKGNKNKVHVIRYPMDLDKITDAKEDEDEDEDEDEQEDEQEGDSSSD